jgi:hypothetical protein
MYDQCTAVVTRVTPDTQLSSELRFKSNSVSLHGELDTKLEKWHGTTVASRFL